MSKLFNKNDTVFLYVKFVDKLGNPVENVDDPVVRILHEKEGQVYEDLEWTSMEQLSNTEYYYNYNVPYDSDCGLHDVIYRGTINGEMASVIESFHVINKSEIYADSIKLYGYVTDSMNNLPLSNVGIELISNDDIYVTQSYTKENGYWESFIYPGEYSCTFKKDGFESLETNIQVGDDNNEIQFNNITLESKEIKTCGNGAYAVTDSYILKNGIPLDGLLVEVSNILSPKEVIAKCITNNKGVWKLFLDPGFYLLRVSGNSMNQDFNRTMRVKVDDSGKYDFDDMDENKAGVIENYISQGEGDIKYSDKIYDGNGNPITDVQVSVYQNDKIVAQSYTDSTGTYELFLKSGEYLVDIYHPFFKEIANFNIKL